MQRYLHLYNRGVEKRSIFSSNRDRERFLQAVRICRLVKSPKVSRIFELLNRGIISPDDDFEEKWSPVWIEILAFCLMPNHFHLEVKELITGGVSKFAQRLGNSYTLYFNTRNERTGRLFESPYKSIEITTDEQLVHLSRYIHTNPINSSKIKLNANQLKIYPWTSLPIYFGEESKICNPEETMNFFRSNQDYWKFVKAGINKKQDFFASSVPHPMWI